MAIRTPRSHRQMRQANRGKQMLTLVLWCLQQKSRAKPGSKPSYVPTPVYSPGTLENQYLKDNELCFHCLRKGHTTRFCPVKHHDQKPATKLVLPADYQPDKTPSGWFPSPKIADMFALLHSKCRLKSSTSALVPENMWTNQRKPRLLSKQQQNLDIHIYVGFRGQ